MSSALSLSAPAFSLVSALSLGREQSRLVRSECERGVYCECVNNVSANLVLLSPDLLSPALMLSPDPSPELSLMSWMSVSSALSLSAPTFSLVSTLSLGGEQSRLEVSVREEYVMSV